MIDRNCSRAKHLLIALPLASVAAGFFLSVIIGISQVVNFKFDLETIYSFLQLLLMLLFFSFCILIAATPIALISYFALKKFNQLKLWAFISLGAVTALCIGIPSLIEGNGMGVVLGLVSCIVSGVTYFVLEKLALNTKSFHKY